MTNKIVVNKNLMSMGVIFVGIFLRKNLNLNNMLGSNGFIVEFLESF